MSHSTATRSPVTGPSSVGGHANPETENPYLLELNRVTRFYGTVIGVNDLNLTLTPGAYGLVGPNGAGKTTLIELITGALRPSLGTVRLFGVNPRVHEKVLFRLGLCPARDILLPRVSAFLWVKHLLQVGGWHPREAGQRAEEVLLQVGLKASLHRPMGSYSLGMRQRAKIAQAIAHDPEFLILDEPFNGLDPIGRHEMTALLRQWSERGRSILLASHVLHEVEAVTDAFLLILGGRLLASGTSGELRSLLADIPQEITLVGPDASTLAARLLNLSSVDSLVMASDRSQVSVAAREPMELYQQLMQIIASEGLRIERILGAEGDLDALFRALTSRHQGQH